MGGLWNPLTVNDFLQHSPNCSYFHRFCLCYSKTLPSVARVCHTIYETMVLPGNRMASPNRKHHLLTLGSFAPIPPACGVKLLHPYFCLSSLQIKCMGVFRPVSHLNLSVCALYRTSVQLRSTSNWTLVVLAAGFHPDPDLSDPPQATLLCQGYYGEISLQR